MTLADISLLLAFTHTQPLPFYLSGLLRKIRSGDQELLFLLHPRSVVEQHPFVRGNFRESSPLSRIPKFCRYLKKEKRKKKVMPRGLALPVVFLILISM
jgi:hypothetical protein